MESAIEKLARLRLRLTKNMLSIDKSSAYYQDLIRQEIQNIQNFGISQAEFQAFNRNPELQHLVTVDTQPNSQMEMSNKLFYRVQERKNHYNQVLRNRQLQVQEEQEKALESQEILDQRLVQSVKRSQSQCQTKVEKVRSLRKPFDRKLHQKEYEDEQEMLRQELESREARQREIEKQQEQDKMQYLKDLRNQRDSKANSIKHNLKCRQYQEEENSFNLLQKLSDRDKYVEMTKSDRLDELKIRRINLEAKLRDAQERSNIAKQQLEDTKRTLALKNMAPRYIPARSPPKHPYKSKKDLVEHLNEEKSNYLYHKFEAKDKQNDERKQMFKEKMNQFYQTRKHDRELDTQQVQAQKRDLEEIDEYHKRLHYYKIQEKSDNFIRSRSQMQDTLRSWSRSPHYTE